jgi:hypothetical protein
MFGHGRLVARSTLAASLLSGPGPAFSQGFLRGMLLSFATGIKKV